MKRLSVILPTHNPDPGRLARTLTGLVAQSLPVTDWELLVVDNASRHPIEIPSDFASSLPLRIVREPTLGLTAARRRGFSESTADICVLVDDDNVLAPRYLTAALDLLAAHPRVAVAGGPVHPEFETAPPAWTGEFHALLALRDLGPATLIDGLNRAPKANHFNYPLCAPIGAGMVIRRAVARSWSEASQDSTLTDRKGTALTSGGDNDIVLHALHAGHLCGYFPELSLTHLIPASRLSSAYLARLNRGIQCSWMQVLYRHQANPWPKLSRNSARLRMAKAWLTYRGWSRPAGMIRWAGACGHFEGRIHP